MADKPAKTAPGAPQDSREDAPEIAWIRELAAVLDDTGLTEIEIERSDVRVRVARTAAPMIAASPAPAPIAGVPTASPAPAPAAQASGTDAATAPPPGAIPSPMVGTIYLSPTPGADAFVKVGDRVSEGQTLMIVEAMKTMNPVAAPRAGVVKEILVKNEQPVEFGELLLVVE